MAAEPDREPETHRASDPDGESETQRLFTDMMNNNDRERFAYVCICGALIGHRA